MSSASDQDTDEYSVQYSHQPTDMAFSPDGKRLASGGGGP
jgi:hypothetical protein